MGNDDDKTRSHIALTKGTMVSHYRIIEMIGAGGMGEVYLAEDAKLNRKVALKFLPTHLCQDEDCRKRFKREAQAAAKLSHPNIIHVYEVSEYQGRPFFAMEHVEGRSLREHASGKELSIEQILELGIQICEGLNDAHEKGITHRDIKPSNILIDSHGRAKIVDFGLASVVGQEHLTKTGSTFGTVGYMSPEQILGKQVDHRSDLFSVGVVLYELITKQNPFKRDSEAATLKAVSDDPPEPMARFKSSLPDGLQAVIDKALEKDIKTRYQHADGMLSDLMRIKRSLASTQFTGSVSAQSVRSSKTWWFVTALIVIAAAVILIVKEPWITRTTSDQPARIMLAVLPFENLGDPEDEYFADGMTEEITSRLGMISGLGVIARTSTMHYKGTKKSLPEIASELGVDYVLEGSVRWDKVSDTDFVRITPQLIRVTDNTHLWASNYERPLTRVFTVQSDIAGRIAEALDIALLSSEQESIEWIPTDNLEAYHAYLKAEDVFWRLRLEEGEFKQALAWYQKAINLDSTFAAAYVGLGRYHIFADFMLFDKGKDHKKLAKQAFDRAIAVDPNLSDAHFGLAWYYNNFEHDRSRSMEEIKLALELNPSNAEAQAMLGALFLFKGDMIQAKAASEKAYHLDPRSPLVVVSLCGVYERLKRYVDADQLYGRLLQMDSSSVLVWFGRARMYLLWKGDIQLVRQSLKDIPDGNTDNPIFQIFLAHLNFLDRRYDDALSCFPAGAPSTLIDSTDYYITKGQFLYYKGDVTRSRMYFDSLLTVVEGRRSQESTRPESPYSTDLIWAYAGLGMHEKARNEAESLLESVLATDDFSRQNNVTVSIMRIYLMMGEYERAFDLLEQLLARPNDETSFPVVKIDPRWDPVRDHPRYKALLEKYGTEH